MKKILLVSGISVIMMGCSLLSPYQITFTTKENEAVNPQEDTLDLVISSNALAYVSSYQCADEPEVIMLPVLKEDMVAQMVQYIDLTFLADQKAESLCTINVTAFDRSTTSTASKKISVYMYSKPLLDAKENEFCGGIAGLQCEEGFSCKLTGDFPDAGGSCVKEEVQANKDEVLKQLTDACKLSGGEWKACEDESDTLCVSKCEFKKETEAEISAATSTEAAVLTPTL